MDNKDGKYAIQYMDVPILILLSGCFVIQKCHKDLLRGPVILAESHNIYGSLTENITALFYINIWISFLLPSMKHNNCSVIIQSTHVCLWLLEFIDTKRD